MKKLTQKELNEVIRLHALYLTDSIYGIQGILKAMDLIGLYFTDADLKGADLTSADLKGATLIGADLTGVKLTKEMIRDMKL